METYLVNFIFCISCIKKGYWVMMRQLFLRFMNFHYDVHLYFLSYVYIFIFEYLKIYLILNFRQNVVNEDCYTGKDSGWFCLFIFSITHTLSFLLSLCHTQTCTLTHMAIYIIFFMLFLCNYEMRAQSGFHLLYISVMLLS